MLQSPTALRMLSSLIIYVKLNSELGAYKGPATPGRFKERPAD